MSDEISNGTIRVIDGIECIYYDGYWLRHYSVHSDSIADKKNIIDQMTRRVFHHVETGINTPGNQVETIRASYERETSPHKKRVKGAMLAGALLNRGRDILKSLVNLEAAGVEVAMDNPLYTECGHCLSEALQLGHNIKLNDGGAGNTELWGEPFRVFTMPMSDFFETRYIKLAQTMSGIDKTAAAMQDLINSHGAFHDLKKMLDDLTTTAKHACETLRSDPAIFEIWPAYIAAREQFEEFELKLSEKINSDEFVAIHRKFNLIREGGALLARHTNLRVPIPESVDNFLAKCENCRSSFPN